MTSVASRLDHRCTRAARRGWLAFAVLALVLHILAGGGLLKRPPTGERFVAELCTSHGLIKGGSPAMPEAMHECCTLCAAAVPLLAIAMPPALPALLLPAARPLPALAVRSHQGAWPAAPPRGPPAFS